MLSKPKHHDECNISLGEKVSDVFQRDIQVDSFGLGLVLVLVLVLALVLDEALDFGLILAGSHNQPTTLYGTPLMPRCMTL